MIERIGWYEDNSGIKLYWEGDIQNTYYVLKKDKDTTIYYEKNGNAFFYSDLTKIKKYLSPEKYPEYYI